jgi:very-short-patch-repair endonuclease
MRNYAIAPSGTVHRAKQLRRESTDAEQRLWRGLREAFPEAKFRRQSPVGPYIADFLSFRHKLIVEVDGGQHSPDVDARRTAFLKREGYRVLRFWNNEVLENTDGVLQAIGLALHPHPNPLPKGEGVSAAPSTNPSPLGRGRGPSRQRREGEGQRRDGGHP